MMMAIMCCQIFFDRFFKGVTLSVNSKRVPL
jgi:hypothetical protein